jgi:hypothetical protein
VKHVWLIEDNHLSSIPNWFAGWILDSPAMKWTNDAWTAIWFVRRQDAEEVMHHPDLDGWGFLVIQHAFDEEPRP